MKCVALVVIVMMMVGCCVPTLAERHDALSSYENMAIRAIRECNKYIAAEVQGYEGLSYASVDGKYVINSIWAATPDTNTVASDTRAVIAIEYAIIYPGLQVFQQSRYLCAEVEGESCIISDDMSAFKDQPYFALNLKRLKKYADFSLAEERKYDAVDEDIARTIDDAEYLLDTERDYGKALVDGIPYKRTSYLITCDSNMRPADYAKYKYVVIIDYVRYVYALPYIDEEAVGVFQDGTAEICRTPEELRKRESVSNLFADTSITVVSSILQ